MSSAHPELILALRQSGIAAEVGGDGFHPMKEDSISSVCGRAGLWLGPRDHLEHDPSFRQLIPYIVLTEGARVVTYRRTVSGTERRLHGAKSLGVGGHIEFEDIACKMGQIDFWQTVTRAATREVREETRQLRILERDWCGLLLDDTTDVGRVHIGVVGIWTIASEDIVSAEAALELVTLEHAESLNENEQEWERWSAMLVPTVQEWLRRRPR